jgi:hypothetical protein
MKNTQSSSPKPPANIQSESSTQPLQLRKHEAISRKQFVVSMPSSEAGSTHECMESSLTLQYRYRLVSQKKRLRAWMCGGATENSAVELQGWELAGTFYRCSWRDRRLAAVEQRDQQGRSAASRFSWKFADFQFNFDCWSFSLTMAMNARSRRSFRLLVLPSCPPFHVLSSIASLHFPSSIHIWIH